MIGLGVAEAIGLSASFVGSAQLYKLEDVAKAINAIEELDNIILREGVNAGISSETWQKIQGFSNALKKEVERTGYFDKFQHLTETLEIAFEVSNLAKQYPKLAARIEATLDGAQTKTFLTEFPISNPAKLRQFEENPSWMNSWLELEKAAQPLEMKQGLRGELENIHIYQDAFPDANVAQEIIDLGGYNGWLEWRKIRFWETITITRKENTVLIKGKGLKAKLDINEEGIVYGFIQIEKEELKGLGLGRRVFETTFEHFGNRVRGFKAQWNRGGGIADNYDAFIRAYDPITQNVQDAAFKTTTGRILTRLGFVHAQLEYPKKIEDILLVNSITIIYSR